MRGSVECGLGLELMRMMGHHGASTGIKEVGVDLGWWWGRSCGGGGGGYDIIQVI